MTLPTRWLRWLALGAVSTLFLVACSSGGTSTQATSTTATTAAAEQITIDVMGAFRGAEADDFQKVIAVFEKQNPNITVNYEGSAQFETDIQVRVKAGNPPDIAAFPQPGAVAQFAQSGDLVALPSSVVTSIKSNYQPGWLDLGSVGGTPYGVFHRVNVKGFVWYNKPAFEAAGYAVPKTWDDFQSLLNKMKSSGTSPFCIGNESGDATGWPGTDWVETYMLRMYPSSDYTNWYTGKLKFDSSQVNTAWSDVGKIWLDPDMAYGGTKTIATTGFKESAAMLFDPTPKCWLVMQGSFVTGFFPDSVQKNLDSELGVFAWPKMADVPFALEVGGDQFVIFKGHDSGPVTKFMQFLTTPASAEPWAALGNALFPHKGQNLDIYPNKVIRTLAQDLTTAESVEFDASDQMPPAVNQAFWKGVTDWLTGTSLSTVESNIDAAWSSSS